jgi:hypothetical protein
MKLMLSGLILLLGLNIAMAGGSNDQPNIQPDIGLPSDPPQYPLPKQCVQEQILKISEPRTTYLVDGYMDYSTCTYSVNTSPYWPSALATCEKLVKQAGLDPSSPTFSCSLEKHKPLIPVIRVGCPWPAVEKFRYYPEATYGLNPDEYKRLQCQKLNSCAYSTASEGILILQWRNVFCK